MMRPAFILYYCFMRTYIRAYGAVFCTSFFPREVKNTATSATSGYITTKQVYKAEKVTLHFATFCYISLHFFSFFLSLLHFRYKKGFVAGYKWRITI